MFLAGALPTGLAGWWIGTHPGAPSAALVAAAGGSLAISLTFSWLAWRWFVLPLRELERGLERWTQGDLGTPLDEKRLGGWRRLGPQFARAQSDLALALAEAKAGLALERARLEALVEKLPDALIMTNLRWRSNRVDAAALPLLGANTRDAEPGRRAWLVPRDALRRRGAGAARGAFRRLGSARSRPRRRPGELVCAALHAQRPRAGVGVLMIHARRHRWPTWPPRRRSSCSAVSHDLRAPLFGMSTSYGTLVRALLGPDLPPDGLARPDGASRWSA